MWVLPWVRGAQRAAGERGCALGTLWFYILGKSAFTKYYLWCALIFWKSAQLSAAETIPITQDIITGTCTVHLLNTTCKAKHCSYFWFTEEKMRFREFNQTLLFSFLDQILVFSLKLEPLTEPWSAGPTCACCEHITWQELPPIVLLLVPGNSAKKLQVL